MLAVAGDDPGGLLLGRDSHKSIVVGLGLRRSAATLDHAAVGRRGSVFHRQGDLIDWRHLAACADLLMTASPNVLLYAVSAEQLTPYPPGIPVVVPGERLTKPIVEYLRSGLAAGMSIPDVTDPTPQTFRVGTLQR